MKIILIITLLFSSLLLAKSHLTQKQRIDLNQLRIKKLDKSHYLDKKPVDKSEEELRLILQIFIYQNDLVNAYKVATLGYKRLPKSYYWNQKMAEISKWTNRSARSMKHLRFMYEVKYDPAIEKELIEYGSNSYQYEEIEPLVINRTIKNPTKKNIELMILVFKKVGSPEKVLKVLDAQYKKDSKNIILLTKALELTLEMGDLELANKYVKMIQKNVPYSKEDAVFIAKYYYVTHNIEQAFRSLIPVKQDKLKSVKYYQLASDFGWYLQNNEAAAIASKYLMDINKGRLVDYERISFVYQKTNSKLAAKATKRAYEEYKYSYLFYSYANGAIKNKNFKELLEFIKSIEKHKSPLFKEALYWLIKSKVYGFYKMSYLEEQALHMAYEIEPNNMMVKLELLWFYIDAHNNKEVKIILTDMAEGNTIERSSFLPMASAYFYLNDINRASYYTQKLLELHDSITKSLQFKFLQAYIYQIQNSENSFRLAMREILDILKKKAKINPKLKKNDKYLSDYLRAAMEIINPDKFEKKLKKAKPYLSEQNYNEISYSWAIKNNAHDKSLNIYYKMHQRALWVSFSNALVLQDHTKVQNLLHTYLYSLAVGDASRAAYRDGQKALSQTIIFEGLRHNDKNSNAYMRHLNLSKELSDKFESKFSYYNRSPLLQKYLQVKNTTYLLQGYYFVGSVEHALNESLNKTLLVSVPKERTRASFGLKKKYNRAFLEANIAYNKSMQSYMEYSIKGSYKLKNTVMATMQVSKNIESIDSTQLLLGAKKDMLAVSMTYNILNSTSINLLHQSNKYSSQDGVSLGDGIYDTVSLSYKIRNGYPDMNIGIFYNKGAYNETVGSRGVIDKLQGGEFPVLPSDFYDIGLTLSYGMANSGLYTRVWRPFIEFSPYYNSTIDNYTYGFKLGYGGKVWHQDHLSIGAYYTNAVSGVGGSILEIFLDYKFMYYHP